MNVTSCKIMLKIIISFIVFLFSAASYSIPSHPLLIPCNSEQKKTNFFVVPTLVSRLGGIAGWGCHPLLIKGGTILDLSKRGKSANDIQNGFVLIEGNRIVKFGKLLPTSKFPKNAKVIDAKGKFILPGLIDGFAAINNQSYANAYLYMGVTSIIAVDGGRRGPFFGNANPGPNIYRLESVGDEKKSDEEHIKDFETLYKKGYKVVLLKYALLPHQVKKCKKRANALGMVTIGELGYTTYKEGCDIGVEAFVHTTRYSMDIAPWDMAKAVADQPFSDDLSSPKWKYYKFLSQIKKNDPNLLKHAQNLGNSNTYIMPTQSLSYLDIPGSKNPWKEPVAQILDAKDINNPADKLTGKHTYKKEVQEAYTNLILNEKNIENVYYKNGAKYLAGSATDVWGTMPGISLHTELEMLHRIGLSKREAIAAATENFAHAFGWKIGKIKPGYAADIIIVHDNPLEDLNHLKRIDILILNGRVIDRNKLVEK